MKQYDFIAETDENGKRVVSVANAPKRRKIDIIPLILCFFLSLGIWIYTINLNDTDVTATLTIPIEIEGVDALQERNDMMIYGVDTKEIVVTVKGSNRDLRRFSQADYRAVIDVSDIAESGRHSRTVNVIVPAGSTIALDMKELVSVNFYTDVKVTREVSFGYIKGHMITNSAHTCDIEQSADSVEVTGPKSIVDSIVAAKFHIPDGEYYTSKSFLGFQLDFLDKNGDNITYDSSVVTYSTTDLLVKVVVTKEWPIAIDVKIPDGVVGIDAILDLEKVYVKGDPALESSVDKYTLVLGRDEVEIGNSITVELTNDDLPAGVELASPEQTLKITFVSADSRNIDDQTGDGAELTGEVDG